MNQKLVFLSLFVIIATLRAGKFDESSGNNEGGRRPLLEFLEKRKKESARYKEVWKKIKQYHTDYNIQKSTVQNETQDKL